MDGNVITSKILPKFNFDHHPISLSLEKEEDLGPIPFHFSPLWIERVGFLDIVHLAWSHYVVGSPNFIWEKKLNNTKIALKNWIKQPQKTPSSNRIEKVSKLAEFQFEMEENDITISQLACERSAQLISFQAFRQEEEALRLKSRGLWLRAGDKKSAFFHRQCRARLSRNHIFEISTT